MQPVNCVFNLVAHHLCQQFLFFFFYTEIAIWNFDSFIINLKCFFKDTFSWALLHKYFPSYIVLWKLPFIIVAFISIFAMKQREAQVENVKIKNKYRVWFHFWLILPATFLKIVNASSLLYKIIFCKVSFKLGNFYYPIFKSR